MSCLRQAQQKIVDYKEKNYYFNGKKVSQKEINELVSKKISYEKSLLDRLIKSNEEIREKLSKDFSKKLAPFERLSIVLD